MPPEFLEHQVDMHAVTEERPGRLGVARESAVGQLTDELVSLAARVVRVVGDDRAEQWQDQVVQAAPQAVARLAHPATAERVAADLIALLWPDDEPPLEWWASPLGALLGRGIVGTWTRAQAATVLTVHDRAAADLVASGSDAALRRGADGGLDPASVLELVQRIGTRTCTCGHESGDHAIDSCFGVVPDDTCPCNGFTPPSADQNR